MIGGYMLPHYTLDILFGLQAQILSPMPLLGNRNLYQHKEMGLLLRAFSPKLSFWHCCLRGCLVPPKDSPRLRGTVPVVTQDHQHIQRGIQRLGT